MKYLLIIFSLLFITAVIRPQQTFAQGQPNNVTCQVGKYCCGLDDPNLCGWITFKLATPDVLYACEDQAGTINCRVLNRGAQFSCPAKGTACSGALSCSTQTPGAVVQQCADGACGAELTVKQQCANNACNNGACSSGKGQIIVPVNPDAKDFFTYDFTSIAIQSGFAVLTVWLILSVIKK